MTTTQQRRWSRHPIALGVCVGVTLGATYLIFNNTVDEESGVPVNAAQLAENSWTTQDITPQKPTQSIDIEFDKVDALEEDASKDPEGRAMPLAANVPAISLENPATVAAAEPVKPMPEAKAISIEQEAKVTLVAVESSPSVELAKAEPKVKPTKVKKKTPPVEKSVSITPTDIVYDEIPVGGNVRSAFTETELLPLEGESTLALTESEANAASLEEQPLAQEEVHNKPTSRAKQFSEQEEQLLATNKSHYTLQLLGGREEKSIKKFIKQHELEGKSFCFRTKRGGKDWFIAVYGEFDSQKAAKAALNDIPTLQDSKLQPWVRDLNAVHEDILKNRKG